MTPGSAMKPKPTSEPESAYRRSRTLATSRNASSTRGREQSRASDDDQIVQTINLDFCESSVRPLTAERFVETDWADWRLPTDQLDHEEL